MTGKTEVLGVKPPEVSLCTPITPHELSWDSSKCLRSEMSLNYHLSHIMLQICFRIHAPSSLCVKRDSKNWQVTGCWHSTGRRRVTFIDTTQQKSITSAYLSCGVLTTVYNINPLNAELNPICHLLALLEVHHIFHVSGLGVKYQ